jgi:MSHA biogenesis protein MshN
MPTDASTANEHAESEYRRGTAAIRRGDIVEGGDALRSALRIAPTHAPARQALLALLMEQQRWADAETLALDGVGLMPQRSDWALLAARLMYERGEAAAALTLLDQYAGNARQNADYQVMRALLLQRANRNADAADCYQAALAIRPQEGRWWYGLGLALDADHREALARQAYEKARESNNLPAELRQAVERRLR